MTQVNMNAIMKKAEKFMDSKSGITKRDEVIKKIVLGRMSVGSHTTHTPEEAAQKFIQTLLSSIASSGLSSNAINVASNLDYTITPSVSGAMYQIAISFVGDMSRMSLDPAHYDGIKNIVALFNNGVDHTMKPVHGIWHGKETWSRTNIPGTYFIQNAVADFMGNYAQEYNVVDVQIDNAFQN